MSWNRQKQKFRAITILVIVFLLGFESVMYNVAFASVDATNPIFHSVEVDREEGTTGDQILISVATEYKDSETRRVSVHYQTPLTERDYKVPLTFNTDSGNYEGKIVIDDQMEAGAWKIRAIIIDDYEENTLIIYNQELIEHKQSQDLSAGNFHIYGTNTDVTKPVFRSAKIDHKEATVGDEVKVSVDAEDMESGIKSAEVFYQTPHSERDYKLSLMLNPESGNYEGTVNIVKYMEPGTWKIRAIQIDDHASNSLVVYNKEFHDEEESNTFDLRSADFLVFDTNYDYTEPIFHGVEVDLKKGTVGDQIKVIVDAEDEDSGISRLEVFYQTPVTKGEHKLVLELNPDSEKYEGFIRIKENTEAGIWKIKSIIIDDYGDNAIFIYSDEFYPKSSGTDLSKGDFNVYGTKVADVPDGYIGIYTADDLNAIRENLDAKYMIMNDIDLRTAMAEGGNYYRNGAGWEPIGSAQAPFRGILDGNGHTITGLNIAISTDEDVSIGLFSHTHNAEIKNIVFDQSKIRVERSNQNDLNEPLYAQIAVGTIAGVMQHTKVINTTVKTEIDITTNNQFVFHSISSQSSIGGMAGTSYDSSFLHNTVEGELKAGSTNESGQRTVSARDSIGGVVGEGQRTTIEHSLNLANVSVKGFSKGKDESWYTGYAGGFEGYGYQSIMKNSTNKGTISGEGSSSRTTIAAGGMTAMGDNSTYENTKNEGTILTKENFQHEYNSYSLGLYSGGIAGSLRHSTLTTSENNGKIIGGTSGGIAGQLNGGNTLSHSKNSGEVEGDYFAGGLVGGLYGSTLKKSSNEGQIQGGDSGGVVGDSYASTILESHNSGSVQAVNNAGGLVASLSGTSQFSASIATSFNTGTVNGNFAGGLVGRLHHAMVTDAFNIGPVTFSHMGGGLVGTAERSTIIRRAYQLGSMNDENFYRWNYMGAIIGGGIDEWSANNRLLEDVYYVDSAVHFPISDDQQPGIKKLTFEQMQTQERFGKFDFEKVWVIDPQSNYTFPQLRNHSIELAEEQTINLFLKNVPKQTVYAKGKPLNLEGAELFGRTSAGNEYQLELSQVEVTGFDPEKVGNQRPTLQYEGLSTSFAVEVKDTFTVTFRDWDGQVLKTEKVMEGGAATAPKPPVEQGFTFIGWDYDFTNVRNDLWISPMYEINQYTVTFIDFNGDVLKTETVNYGSRVQPPIAPVREGYTFIGWDQELYMITSDLTVQAQYEKNKYLVTFYDYDGSGLAQVIVEEGQAATAPEVPTRVGYTFIGWDVPFENVTIDLDVYAQYELNQYDVIFKDGNSVLAEQRFSHNAVLNVPNDPVKAGHTFIGWYTDSSFQSKFSFGLVVTDGIVLYVYFEANPSTPQSVTVASEGYNKLKVSWGLVTGADGYEVYQAPSRNGTYSRVQTVTNGATTSVTRSSLKTGTTYFYKIRAYRVVDGIKIYSNYSSIASGKPVLARVISVTTTSASYNQIRINWGRVTGASGYEIYRATSKDGKYTRVKSITSGSTLTFTNGSRATGTTYYYKVRAYRVVDGTRVYGTFSAVRSGKAVLPVPKNVKASKASATSATISWSRVTGASGYEVHRATSKNGKYSRVGTVTSGGTVRFTNAGLKRGTKYHYKVRAYRVVNGKRVYSGFTPVESL
ncbi:InlB B-repeat-containing protein [Alkalihalobacterium elongatum]|uniref:InlB B-repeat-containing protein n=1 Tax=Alkalihalobacterium elongatum TaxID=2675466 RepID=UPI001C1F86D6|nr:InlB B-repeat-containing protein [Alkalihalobacterium elongatum]